MRTRAELQVPPHIALLEMWSQRNISPMLSCTNCDKWFICIGMLLHAFSIHFLCISTGYDVPAEGAPDDRCGFDCATFVAIPLMRRGLEHSGDCSFGLFSRETSVNIFLTLF